MPKSKSIELTEIVAHFQSLEDPRSSINRRHPLVSVLVIALMAVLSGADGPTAIYRWAQPVGRIQERGDADPAVSRTGQSPSLQRTVEGPAPSGPSGGTGSSGA